MEFIVNTGQCADLIIQFMYGQNQSKIANIGYCAENKEQFREDLDELLSQECNSVVCCYEENTLAGAVAFDVDCEKNCAEVWGPFIASQYTGELAAIADRILEYAMSKSICNGELRFFPNIENTGVTSYLEGKGARFMGRHTTYRMENTEYVNSSDSASNAQLIGPCHYEEFIALHNKIFPNTYYSGEEIISKLDTDNKIHVVAKNQKLAGYVYTELDIASKHGRIEFFGVAESERGQGYGKCLLKTALRDLFVNNDAVSAELCVSSKNDTAIDLYKKVGFNVSKEYMHYCMDAW